MFKIFEYWLKNAEFYSIYLFYSKMLLTKTIPLMHEKITKQNINSHRNQIILKFCIEIMKKKTKIIHKTPFILNRGISIL